MPLQALLDQLALFGERTGRDLSGPALELVRGYRPETGSERWLEAADGLVAVHGPLPPSLCHSERSEESVGPARMLRCAQHDKGGFGAGLRGEARSKRALAARLQEQGIAAAPVLSEQEARADSGLPPRERPRHAAPMRGRPRVLDLTHLLAGPFATWLLAEAGADVLKVERPETGDGLRAGEPAQFARLNAGKRRITLELRRDGSLLRQLAERADLVVHNFRSWPFGQLPAPVLSLPGLAASGPYAGWRSYAATVHAMLGFSERLGPAPLPWADYLAGAWAANRALDVLATKHSEALPQAACMPAAIPDAWPSLEPAEEAPIPMPALGEHNDQVYGELGLDEDRINRLYVAGII